MGLWVNMSIICGPFPRLEMLGNKDQGREWKSCLGHILPKRQFKYPGGNAKQETGYLSLDLGCELKHMHNYKWDPLIYV